MKAYELMKLAAENPAEYEGKRYKVVSGYLYDFTGHSHKEFHFNRIGQVVDETLAIYFSNDTEIEEIPQPVPFMEAVKAYSEGKTVECHLGAYVTIYSRECRHCLKGYAMRSKSGQTLTDEEILNGIWTIKE